MEILMKTPTAPVAAVLMDFDGTVSTLRFGWDQVMRAMMLEMIPGGEAPDPELVEKVDQYLDQSAGIQTIYQMKWLMAQVLEQGKMPNPPQDPWWYKDQYNQRLMAQVEGRIQRALAGAREEYLSLIHISSSWCSAYWPTWWPAAAASPRSPRSPDSLSDLRRLSFR